MIVSVLPSVSSFLNPDQLADTETLEEYLRIQAAILEKVHPANISLAEAERLAQAVTEFDTNLYIVSATDDSRENWVVSLEPQRVSICAGSTRVLTEGVSRRLLAGGSPWTKLRAWRQNLDTETPSRPSRLLAMSRTSCTSLPDILATCLRCSPILRQRLFKRISSGHP